MWSCSPAARPVFSPHSTHWTEKAQAKQLQTSFLCPSSESCVASLEKTDFFCQDIGPFISPQLMKTVQPAKQGYILKTNIILDDYFWWKLVLVIKNDWRSLEKCFCQITVLLVSGDVLAKQGKQCTEIFLCVLWHCPSLGPKSPWDSAQIFIYSWHDFDYKKKNLQWNKHFFLFW